MLVWYYVGIRTYVGLRVIFRKAPQISDRDILRDIFNNAL
jgi:hypothetical protein